MSTIINQSKENLHALALVLSTKSQIPYQHYTIGSLFLINRTLNNDENHFWEYEVYKLDSQGDAYLFESITVNAKDDELWLFDWLKNWERIPFDEMKHPLSGNLLKDTKPTLIRRQVTEFKRLFEDFQKNY